MKKTLAIVSYDSEAGSIYFAQIKNVFKENLNIKKYSIDSDEISNGIIADLVLVQSVEDFEQIKNYIPLSCQVLFCCRTISKCGLDKILNIPNNTEVVVLDESIELANGIISILSEIGVRNVRLIPASMKIKEILQDKIVIILGESSGIPISPKQVIDIGASLLDISTIIQIGYRLDLNKLVSIENMWQRYNEIVVPAGKLYGAFAFLKNLSESKIKPQKSKNQTIVKGHKAKYNFEDIIGESEPIMRCKKNAVRMAQSNSTVLITGESGTGKELFAQAIHNSSSRRDNQFVVINCGALPESLLESELFGYEEGAFTGAKKGGKPGLFELANEGTLFFDEIGEMPLTLQPRLLRVLQERQVMRIGGDKLINIDVRLIAATNRNIKEMVNNGEFRVDLFYRINVLSLKIPSLNSRSEDIFILINNIKKELKGDFVLTEKAKQAFLKHDWRGNVRELRNYVENIINLGITKVDIDDLPFELEASLENKVAKGNVRKSSNGLLETAGKDLNSYIFILEELEKALKENKRIGRRSIFKKCEESNQFISEQEIRNILLNLEKNQMVKILKGRGGTIITQQGREFIKNLI